MRGRAEQAIALLEQRASSLNEATRPLADAVLADRERLLARFDGIRDARAPGARIRVHGDYHLGQVLRTEEDFIVLDFEGEPARPLAERRAKESPLKDVAGMVRSYSYAAYASLFAFTVHAPDDFPTLEPWAEAWAYWAADAFLGGYQAAAEAGAAPEAAWLPAGDDFRRVLQAFVLEKAFYELAYELNSRPDWVRIPLAGLAKMR
jgi:maltose alpha-D-glucosyltransferase/alpha-amylase